MQETIRVQRHMSAGWRKPPNTIAVTRWRRDQPGMWGNRFVVGEPADVWFDTTPQGDPGRIQVHRVRDAAHAVELYIRMLRSSPVKVDRCRLYLAGWNLMCWCEVGKPCHGDVLRWVAAGGDLAQDPVWVPSWSGQPVLFDA